PAAGVTAAGHYHFARVTRYPSVGRRRRRRVPAPPGPLLPRNSGPCIFRSNQPSGQAVDSRPVDRHRTGAVTFAVDKQGSFWVAGHCTEPTSCSGDPVLSAGGFPRFPPPLSVKWSRRPGQSRAGRVGPPHGHADPNGEVPTMPNPSADRNLLFGILALQ